ncbi:MAG TPA: hypothetical protein VFN38_06685, partial [Gemmatimonadaceae bacterium]|nr:hypothetical protein [Gemmatimonadaceae bacterium]
MTRRRAAGTRTEPLPAAPSLFDAVEPAPPYAEVGDAFPGASPASAIAVSTLTQTVKDVVEGAFMPLWVRGEV